MSAPSRNVRSLSHSLLSVPLSLSAPSSLVEARKQRQQMRRRARCSFALFLRSPVRLAALGQGVTWDRGDAATQPAPPGGTDWRRPGGPPVGPARRRCRASVAAQQQQPPFNSCNRRCLLALPLLRQVLPPSFCDDEECLRPRASSGGDGAARRSHPRRHPQPEREEGKRRKTSGSFPTSHSCISANVFVAGSVRVVADSSPTKSGRQWRPARAHPRESGVWTPARA